MLRIVTENLLLENMNSDNQADLVRVLIRHSIAWVLCEETYFDSGILSVPSKSLI